jgi:hypothetical protein
LSAKIPLARDLPQQAGLHYAMKSQNPRIVLAARYLKGQIGDSRVTLAEGKRCGASCRVGQIMGKMTQAGYIPAGHAA